MLVKALICFVSVPPPFLKGHMTRSRHIGSFSGSCLRAAPLTGNHDNSLGLCLLGKLQPGETCESSPKIKKESGRRLLVNAHTLVLRQAHRFTPMLPR